jgi:hypothetical protein
MEVSPATSSTESNANHLSLHSQSTRLGATSTSTDNDTSCGSSKSNNSDCSYTDEGEECSGFETLNTNFDGEASTTDSSGVDSAASSNSDSTQRSPTRFPVLTSLRSKSQSSGLVPSFTAGEELLSENGNEQDRDVREKNESHIPSGRNRVPGGAAAKLMLLGPKGSAEIEIEYDEIRPMSSTESAKVNESTVNDSIVQEMQEAKHEFQKGSTPKRAALTSPANTLDGTRLLKSDDQSEASSAIYSLTPNFLNRNEIFHKTAAAAVSALLTPRASVVASASDLQSVNSCSGQVPASPDNLNNSGVSRNNASSIQLLNQLNLSGNHSLVTKKTEKVLKEMKEKMMDPNSTLTDLLTAIASPYRLSAEMPEKDLGNMVRRKNACGALQVLTTQPNNQSRICWTAGVLPALTCVLIDGLPLNGTEDPFPDKRIRAEYTTARLRAISALTNLSTPPRNRIVVFHTPDLVQTLVQIIRHDRDDLARRGSCALLALLAKSSDNRLLMLHVPGLIDTVRKVIQPRPPRVEPIKDEHRKKLYPWSEDDGSISGDSSNSSNAHGKSKGKKHFSNSEEHRKLGSSESQSEKSNSGDLSNIDGESGSTPKVRGSKTPRELSGYDETVDDVVSAARQNLFALFLHLVKEKENAYCVGHETEFVETLADISKFKESSSHVFAIQIMANLTRHRLNKHLAFKPKSFVPALVEATQSQSFEARLYAMYALQNLSQEKSCRQELAISNNLIVALCDRCRNGDHENERLAAISTLKNLCDEPANLIPMTNTPGCVSTLMHFAHGGVNDATERPVTEMMQYRACDALATLSHWLRKISTSGYALETPARGSGRTNQIKGTLFVPSLREVSWNQWH